MWSSVWLIGVLVTAHGLATTADAAPEDGKTSTSKENDTHKPVCCEHRGAEAGQSCCGQIIWKVRVVTSCEGKDGSPTTEHRISQHVSDCCGLKAYNPLTEMFFDSTIVVIPVSKAKCCGKAVFDEKSQLCCGPLDNKKILIKNSENDLCCGRELYNNKTECCCPRDGELKKVSMNSECPQDCKQ